MHDDVIARMRDRVTQLRKVMDLAHDERVKRIVKQVIDEGEADIRNLEREAAEHNRGDAEQQ